MHANVVYKIYCYSIHVISHHNENEYYNIHVRERVKQELIILDLKFVLPCFLFLCAFLCVSLNDLIA